MSDPSNDPTGGLADHYQGPPPDLDGVGDTPPQVTPESPAPTGPTASFGGTSDSTPWSASAPQTAPGTGGPTDAYPGQGQYPGTAAPPGEFGNVSAPSFNYPSYGAPQKPTKPVTKRGYLIGVVMIIASFVVAAMAGNQLTESIDKWRADPVALGTTATRNLDAGEYDVMVMSPYDGGFEFNMTNVPPNGYDGDYYTWGRSVRVTIIGADGADVNITPTNDTKMLTTDGYRAVAVGSAKIPDAGQYEVTVRSTDVPFSLDPAPEGIGLMQMDVGGLVKRLLIMGALMVILFMGGAILLLVTFIRRRRQRKSQNPQYFVPTNPTWPPPTAQ